MCISYVFVIWVLICGELNKWVILLWWGSWGIVMILQQMMIFDLWAWQLVSQCYLTLSNTNKINPPQPLISPSPHPPYHPQSHPHTNYHYTQYRHYAPYNEYSTLCNDNVSFYWYSLITSLSNQYSIMMLYCCCYSTSSMIFHKVK